MSDVIIARSFAALLPVPEMGYAIRPGTSEDVAFIDSLQKKHSKQVGFFPRAAIEGKIRLGHVLVAESAVDGRPSAAGGADSAEVSTRSPASPPTADRGLPTPLGYLIGNDQYFKRDDLGCIFQINVVPGQRRKLVAASLLKAQFERSAYGCKLYCCWCAQDLEANRFWESMGFVPLAYRVGSIVRGVGGRPPVARRSAVGGEEGEAVSPSSPASTPTADRRATGGRPPTPRVHIFWQKRIRSGDETTPWWFPSKTSGGSIREDRIALPIPPGTTWSDAKPLILPGAAVGGRQSSVGGEEVKMLPSPRKKKSSSPTVDRRPPTLRNGLRFDVPKQGEPLPEDKPVKVKKEKPVKTKPVCDPRLIRAARELRDRWLERVNTVPLLGQAKYDVTRTLTTRPEQDVIHGEVITQRRIAA